MRADNLQKQVELHVRLFFFFNNYIKNKKKTLEQKQKHLQNQLQTSLEHQRELTKLITKLQHFKNSIVESLTIVGLEENATDQNKSIFETFSENLETLGRFIFYLF